MTLMEMEINVVKLMALKAQIKELSKQADEIESAIKKDLDRRKKESVTTENHVICWTHVLSNRFDTNAFKTDHPKLCEQYTRPSTSRRFSIADL